MIKGLILLSTFAALLGPSAHAQTAVTATVTDSDGIAWANGTWSATYQQPAGFPGILTDTLTGQTIPQATISGSLSSSGAFSVNLIPTADVVGANGSSPGVIFQVCSTVTNAPCWSTPPVVIQGSAQSVSSEVAAAIQAPRVTALPSGATSAYVDAEVIGAAGAQYFRTTDDSFRCFAQGAWKSCGLPDYQASAGTGLSVNIAPGKAFCNGALVTYAGGSLSLSASATNYVYLNASSACAVTVSQTVFPAGDFPVAIVQTNGNSVASGGLFDARTMFQNIGSGGGGGGDYSPITLGTTQLVSGATVSQVSNLQIQNLSIGTSPITFTCTADPGGVTAYTLVSFSSGASTTCTESPIGGPVSVGIAQATVAAGGSVQVAYSGFSQCIADNAWTEGDFIGVPKTTAGYCADLGSNATGAIPENTQIFGKAMQSCTAGSACTVLTMGVGHYGTEVVGYASLAGNNDFSGDNTFNGTVLVNQILSAADQLFVSNGQTGNSTSSGMMIGNVNGSGAIGFYPALASGAYNNLAQAGDAALVIGGGENAGTCYDEIPWSSTTGGFRICPSGVNFAQVPTVLGNPLLTSATAASTYLPLAGGTVTGATTFSGTLTESGSLDSTGSAAFSGTVGISGVFSDTSTTAPASFAVAPTVNGYAVWTAGTFNPSNYLTTTAASNTYLSQATAAATYLPLSGGTLSGGIATSSGGGAFAGAVVSNTEVDVNGAAGSYRLSRWMTNSAWRFSLGLDTAAETGDNVGSNLCLYNYSDTSTLLGTPFCVNRATGVIDFTSSPTVPTPAAGDSSSNVPDTQWIDTYFAPVASPAFTGTPTAPTAPAGNSSTTLANTQFVATAIADRTAYLSCPWLSNAALTAADASGDVLCGWVMADATTFTFPTGGGVPNYAYLDTVGPGLIDFLIYWNGTPEGEVQCNSSNNTCNVLPYSAATSFTAQPGDRVSIESYGDPIGSANGLRITLGVTLQ